MKRSKAGAELSAIHRHPALLPYRCTHHLAARSRFETDRKGSDVVRRQQDVMAGSWTDPGRRTTTDLAPILMRAGLDRHEHGRVGASKVLVVSVAAARVSRSSPVLSPAGLANLSTFPGFRRSLNLLASSFLSLR